MFTRQIAFWFILVFFSYQNFISKNVWHFLQFRIIYIVYLSIVNNQSFMWHSAMWSLQRHFWIFNDDYFDYTVTVTRYLFSRQLIKLIQLRRINGVLLIPSNARNLMQTAVVICNYQWIIIFSFNISIYLETWNWCLRKQ